MKKALSNSNYFNVLQRARGKSSQIKTKLREKICQNLQIHPKNKTTGLVIK